ncbi:MAG TPA: zinc ribbon domain-containing protein [Streptosporangiaceae bacterium]
MPGSAKAKAEPAAKRDAPAVAAVAPTPEVKEQAPQIARARAVAVTKTTSTRRLRPGDSICGYCGEGNPPTRKFCSRCGESLVEAEHVKAPWWRRFRVKGGPKTVKLGTTPGKNAKGGNLHGPGFDFKHAASQVYRKARVVVAIAIVAVGAVYGIYPPFRTEVNSIFTSGKDKLVGAVDQKFAPVHAIKCTANAQLKGHPAALACDGFFNNYWLARWTPSPEPTLTVIFAHPVTITRLILHNGAFGRYVQDGRPSSLHLVFSNEESFTITPQDTPQSQTFTIKHAVLIKSIVFQVTAVYQGTVGTNVAISQIELFGIQLPG